MSTALGHALMSDSPPYMGGVQSPGGGFGYDAAAETPTYAGAGSQNSLLLDLAAAAPSPSPAAAGEACDVGGQPCAAADEACDVGGQPCAVAGEACDVGGQPRAVAASGSVVSVELAGLCCTYLQNSMAVEAIPPFMDHLSAFYGGVHGGYACQIYKKDALHYLSFAIRLETLVHGFFKAEFATQIPPLPMCTVNDFARGTDNFLSFDLQVKLEAIVGARSAVFQLPPVCYCTAVINFVCMVLVVRLSLYLLLSSFIFVSSAYRVFARRVGTTPPVTTSRRSPSRWRISPSSSPRCVCLFSLSFSSSFVLFLTV
jgi:hypothetical protein